jgi:cytidine deaminase
MKNDELISAAESILLPRVVKGRLFGDVGAAILSSSGRLFLGVSVDTPSWGLCAERCALASMIAAGEYTFSKAVAVWRNPATHLLHILPPCGVCREFMRSIDDGNLDSEIVLERDRSVRVRELLPIHEWPEPLND